MANKQPRQRAIAPLPEPATSAKASSARAAGVAKWIALGVALVATIVIVVVVNERRNAPVEDPVETATATSEPTATATATAEPEELTWPEPLEEGTAVLALQRAAAYDSGMAMEAMRSFVPADWDTWDYVDWTVTSADAPAVATLSAVNSDTSAAVLMISAQAYTQTPASAGLSEGDWDTTTLATVRDRPTTADFAAGIVESVYTGSTDFEVVAVEPLTGDDLALFNDYLTGLQTQADDYVAESADGSTMTVEGAADCVTLTFTDAYGTARKARVEVVMEAVIASDGTTTYVHWTTPWGTAMYIAEESVYDTYYLAGEQFLANVAYSIKWEAALYGASSAIYSWELTDQAMFLDAVVAEVQAAGVSYVEGMDYTYEAQNLRVMPGWTDIAETRRGWTMPDGSVLRVATLYNRVFADAAGNAFAYEGTPSSIPAGWTELALAETA